MSPEIGNHELWGSLERYDEGVQSCSLALNVIKYPFEDALLMLAATIIHHSLIIVITAKSTNER